MPGVYRGGKFRVGGHSMPYKQPAGAWDGNEAAQDTADLGTCADVLAKKKKYAGPERREPENEKIRAAMNQRIAELEKAGKTPVVDSKRREVFADSAARKCRKTGETHAILGDKNGVLID